MPPPWRLGVGKGLEIYPPAAKNLQDKSKARCPQLLERDLNCCMLPARHRAAGTMTREAGAWAVPGVLEGLRAEAVPVLC